LETGEVIRKYTDFLTRYDSQILSNSIDLIEIPFFEISDYDLDLGEELISNPEESLKAMEIASESFLGDKKVKFRIKKLPKSNEIAIRNIRSKHLEIMWSINGIVKRKSDVRPQVVSARFECPSCGNIITILQKDRKLKTPSKCGCGRQGRFKEVGRELVDGFSMVIEEFTEFVKAGSELKRLTCWVHGPLTRPEIESKIFPGVKIKVIGVLKPFYKQTKGGKDTQLDIFFSVNNIEILESDYDTIEISERDKEEFIEMVKTGDVMEILTSSMFSAIHGLDMVKKGLILQLIGGEKKVLPSGYSARGDIHVLLIGDPGAGKSTCLKLVSSNAPRTRRVSGKGASGVGLTASVVKDELLGGYALEAGALPLTNNGICIVDEFDKLAETETDAIHEALEEQVISIAKANIQATLKAETTLLAAANPKFGRFDMTEPLPTQIKLPPALISRFDLIFVFLDEPDEKRDRAMAKKILSRNREIEEPLLSSKQIKKFIAYTRQFHPTYSSKIEDQIADFYTKIRNTHRSESSKAVPISPRYIEVIRRLSEAHAKLNLRDRIELDDVQVAIDLVMFTLKELTLNPETGELDIDIIQTGYSAKTRSKRLRFFDIVDKLSEKDKKIPYDTLIFTLVDNGWSEQEAVDYVDKAKSNGELYEPKKGFLVKMQLF
jgi:replicative DNA helicase Mcm